MDRLPCLNGGPNSSLSYAAWARSGRSVCEQTIEKGKGGYCASSRGLGQQVPGAQTSSRLSNGKLTRRASWELLRPVIRVADRLLLVDRYWRPHTASHRSCRRAALTPYPHRSGVLWCSSLYRRFAARAGGSGVGRPTSCWICGLAWASQRESLRPWREPARGRRARGQYELSKESQPVRAHGRMPAGIQESSTREEFYSAAGWGRGWPTVERGCSW